LRPEAANDKSELLIPANHPSGRPAKLRLFDIAHLQSGNHLLHALTAPELKINPFSLWLLYENQKAGNIVLFTPF